MKKLILALMVIGIAIPALAVDISLVDNGNGTATIQYTAVAGEVVRGLALIIEPNEADITAVSGINPEFNVNLDAAYMNPGAYVIGTTGTPVANPDAAGEISLPASKISLCLGVVDQGGFQAGASDDGTYSIATISVCGGVAITEDTLRGGIVGDNVSVGTIEGGSVDCGTTVCKGDTDNDNNIDIDDLVELTGFLHPAYSTTVPYKYVCTGIPEGKEAYDADADGDITIGDLVEITGFLHPAYSTTVPYKYVGPVGVCVP